MTEQEKANEIVNKYLINTPIVCGIDVAKQCALIGINEMLEVLCIYEDISKDYQYWKQVKQEIEKL